MAWDLFIQSNQAKWNHALQSLEATLGFHTGSMLTLQFQTLRGALKTKLEVIESSPAHSLVLQSHFRHLLFQHTEQWVVRFHKQETQHSLVEFQYVLSGPFAARVWQEKKLIVNNILNLWLESLKLQSERL
ncbi:hypothetical protein [Marinomonas aquimarina]|nr:hypothetical protein [Marinomonas aquimarina]